MELKQSKPQRNENSEESEAVYVTESLSAEGQKSRSDAKVEVDITPMSPAEMKAIIAQAKETEGDEDCVMCGS